MIKKALTVGLIGFAAWWIYRRYSNAENYLLRADNQDENSVIQKVSLAFEGLNFGEGIGMNISLAGLAYLKDWEGRKTRPNGLHYVYLDSAGLPTIGYGHLIKKGENFEEIDENTASTLLINDVSDAEQIVNNGLKIQVHQFMFDAMVIFAYNWPKFKRSQCLKKINLRDWQGAIDEWKEVINITSGKRKVPSKGLINRRNNEIKLFNEGLNRL